MKNMARMKELQKDLKTLKAEIAEEFKQNLNELFQDFFKTVPIIKAIGWTQYTPYFNDGDECVFNVNEPGFLSTYAGDIDDEPDFLYGSGDIYISRKGVVAYNDNPELNEKLSPHATDIMEMEQFITDADNTEFFKEVFGDHVRIIVTHEGIDVEEYEHD